MDIGSNIKKLRKERGLTQIQLAEKIGAGVHTLKMWECGRHEPSVGMVNKLCDALEVTADELCGLEVPVQPVRQDFAVEANGKIALIEEIMKMDDETFSHLQKYFEFLKRGGS